MTASIGIHYFRFRNNTIFNFIYLKLLSMSKVLKNFSIFISYCYLHISSSFRYYIFF